MVHNTDINAIFHNITNQWMKIEQNINWEYCKHNAHINDQCLLLLLLKRTVYLPGLYCEMDHFDKIIHLRQIKEVLKLSDYIFTVTTLPVDYELWKNLELSSNLYKNFYQSLNTL
jgi:hypothetical protein